MARAARFGWCAMFDLKAARIAAGFVTQQAMAEALDVDRRSVGRWERGEIATPVVVKVALGCMARLRELESA
jgi:DNA-binding XRE family transcriptional regulator